MSADTRTYTTTAGIVKTFRANMGKLYLILAFGTLAYLVHVWTGYQLVPFMATSTDLLSLAVVGVVLGWLVKDLSQRVV